jgi:hypothetical protein
MKGTCCNWKTSEEYHSVLNVYGSEHIHRGGGIKLKNCFTVPHKSTQTRAGVIFSLKLGQERARQGYHRVS